MHYWVDSQSVHGFRCYDNIAPNAKCQRVVVLALYLVRSILLSAGLPKSCWSIDWFWKKTVWVEKQSIRFWAHNLFSWTHLQYYCGQFTFARWLFRRGVNSLNVFYIVIKNGLHSMTKRVYKYIQLYLPLLVQKRKKTSRKNFKQTTK